MTIDVKQHILILGQHVLHFVIAHERSIGLILLFSSLIAGFPIGCPLFVFYLIFKIPVLVIQACIGFGTSGVRRDSLAASYQSRTFGGFTPAGGCFATSQSTAALGFCVPSNLVLMLLSWVFMAAAIALLVDYSHGEQMLKGVLRKVILHKSSPSH